MRIRKILAAVAEAQGLQRGSRRWRRFVGETIARLRKRERNA